MAHPYAYTDQVGPALNEDGDFGKLYQNRGHGLQVNSREGLVDQWTRDGRVFVANNPVIGQPETMSTNGTAILLTDPSLRYTVPAGVIVVPIHVELSIITVAACDDIFAVVATAADSYTTGGDATAMLCKNALINGTSELRATGVTNLHYSDDSITEGGLTAPRLLKIQESQGPGDEATWNPTYSILNGDPMVYLVGPASFLVFAVQETAEAEAEFCMSWAELQPNAVP